MGKDVIVDNRYSLTFYYFRLLTFCQCMDTAVTICKKPEGTDVRVIVPPPEMILPNKFYFGRDGLKLLVECIKDLKKLGPKAQWSYTYALKVLKQLEDTRKKMGLKFAPEKNIKVIPIDMESEEFKAREKKLLEGLYD